MVVIIKKGESRENIEAALKRLEQNSKQSKLSDFYGKLKGAFGDGLTYQKQIRDEWS